MGSTLPASTTNLDLSVLRTTQADEEDEHFQLDPADVGGPGRWCHRHDLRGLRQHGVVVELLHMDACDSLVGGDCPLTFGEMVVYRKTIMVDPAWTPMATDAIYKVESNLAARDGLELFCGTIPIVVV